ncbi:MAG: CAP domain-containing protein [Flavobacteriales bacterium]|nr:CAP domain-containing protein [Flavobacteriales bacterium]
MKKYIFILLNSIFLVCCSTEKPNKESKQLIGEPLELDEAIPSNLPDSSIMIYGMSPNVDELDELIPNNMHGMVEAHNKYRAELNLPKLKWSNKIARSAKKWAIQLKNKGCAMKHSPSNYREGYGENIAWNSGFEETPEGVVDRWASEKKDFNFKTKKCNGGWYPCGHYTQIIWQNTQRVGCAMVKCGNEEVWVCQYDPAGNMNITRGATPY